MLNGFPLSNHFEDLG